MTITPCSLAQVPEIREIFNEAIARSTALYDYKPRTLEGVETWFAAKAGGKFPILGAFADDGTLLGFATFGPFRAFPAYKYSVEHSVYVRHDRRGGGLGRILLTRLIAEAESQGYHMMIGGIDSTNSASIRLHLALGFSHCASIKQAGYKFGRWLDLEFYQLILRTPAQPDED